MPEERKRLDARPFFKPENVILNMQEMPVEKLYETFARLLLRQINAEQEEFVREVVEQCWYRESLLSLAIGCGIAYAYPDHISDNLRPFITESQVAIGISREGIRWYSEKEPQIDISITHELVHIIYFSITMQGEGHHLRIIAQFSRIIKDEDTRNKLIAAQTQEEVVEIVKIALERSFPNRLPPG